MKHNNEYIGRQSKVIYGWRNNSTPKVVATPFPPLNPRNGLQQCPITAAIPIPQSTIAEVSPRASNNNAKYPLPRSPIRQIAALHQLATRLTLRKPGFFDPTLVMSMPVP